MFWNTKESDTSSSVPLPTKAEFTAMGYVLCKSSTHYARRLGKGLEPLEVILCLTFPQWPMSLRVGAQRLLLLNQQWDLFLVLDAFFCLWS